MNIKQHLFINNNWTEYQKESLIDTTKCQLVLTFGCCDLITKPEIFAFLKQQYPNAHIVLASTSGEIIDENVYDNSLVATAIQFENTEIKCIEHEIINNSSYETGLLLMNELMTDELSCVFVVADGININGTELVNGLNKNNLNKITITGGLAGDGARFINSYTGLNKIPKSGNVIGIGFYGKKIIVGHGSVGGWDEFGQERTITKAEKNVLYELDDKNALDLYKTYLGMYVNELPSSALLFPIALKVVEPSGTLVRTILSVNEKDSSMTFAGNMPVGSRVRLMKANFDRIIEGSCSAATISIENFKSKKPELAILISCIGRKLVLKTRTVEEIEIAKEVFGNDTVISGFYSNGEIAPFNSITECELHNQTMTITTFAELP